MHRPLWLRGATAPIEVNPPPPRRFIPARTTLAACTHRRYACSTKHGDFGNPTTAKADRPRTQNSEEWAAGSEQKSELEARKRLSVRLLISLHCTLPAAHCKPPRRCNVPS